MGTITCYSEELTLEQVQQNLFSFFFALVAQTKPFKSTKELLSGRREKEATIVGISIYTTTMSHTVEIIYLHL